MPDPQSPRDTSAASAVRRATADPGVFLVPSAALPDGFGERVAAGDFTPAPARPAATVLLARDGEAGPEVLLLRRHRRSGFAADAWVFPGGVVDDEDRDPALVERMDGPGPDAWAARLGLEDGAEALGYVVAALREAFEETGILLARGGPADAGALETARHALLEGVVGLREVAVSQDLRLSGDALAYVAHWITPTPEPRRYDTRFFLARAAPDAVCRVHRAELTDAVWLAPAAAVREFQEGTRRMLPPTVHTLRRLAGFGAVDEMFSAVAGAPVPPILPVMRRVPDGVAIELPPEARG